MKAAVGIFQHQGKMDIIAGELAVHMIPMAIDQFHEPLRPVQGAPGSHFFSTLQIMV